jgi:glycosyltransferase involved in cell wall biosynthesis
MIAAHKQSHYVIDPAVWETPGSATVTEGLYFGTPSIVPAGTGSADWVKDGIEGYQFRFRDVDSLRETLGRSFRRMDDWERLSAASLEASRRLDETNRQHVESLLRIIS